MRQIAFALTLASAAFLATFSASADSPPAASAQVSHEGTDQTVVEKAMAAMGQGGYRALTPLVPDLKEVMSHAPASYPMIQRGPTTIVHAGDLGEYLTVTGILQAEAQRTGKPAGSSVWTPNTYGLAALLLGGYYDEMHQTSDALAVLEPAMKMQPGNWMLTLEYGACLMGLHRHADAVAAFQETLDHAEIISNEGRARLLRNKGVALIDLDRLNEAEVALNESIRLLPNNPQARNELQYIARLRGGQRRTDSTMTTVPATQDTAPAQQDAHSSSQGEANKPQKGN